MHDGDDNICVKVVPEWIKGGVSLETNDKKYK